MHELIFVLRLLRFRHKSLNPSSSLEQPRDDLFRLQSDGDSELRNVNGSLVVRLG